MNPNTIFNKTRKGMLEIRDRTGGLSMLERRLLILVDGKRSAGDIWKITKVADYEHMLQRLEDAGYIAPGSGGGSTASARQRGVGGGAARPAATRREPAPAASGAGEPSDPRGFMLHTLKTMASPIQYRRLGGKIEEAPNRSALRDLVDPWYQALSENPANLTRVDSVRNELLDMF